MYGMTTLLVQFVKGEIGLPLRRAGGRDAIDGKHRADHEVSIRQVRLEATSVQHSMFGTMENHGELPYVN
jgi:hypothetical protein